MRSKTVDLIKGRLDDSALFRLSQGSSSAKVQGKQQTFFSGVGSHTSVFLIYSLSPSLHHWATYRTCAGTGPNTFTYYI